MNNIKAPTRRHKAGKRQYACAFVDARGRHWSWWALCREFDRAFEDFRRKRGGIHFSTS